MAEEAEVALIEVDIVARVAKSLKRAVVEDCVAVGVDGGQYGCGNGQVYSAECGERVDGIADGSSGFGGHRERLVDALIAVSDKIVDDAFGLPSNDGFKIVERKVAFANCRTGLEGGF